jgi:2,3,4,5-tetrahydropyridine-2,6-dicarboxylate N-succinyltransferase
VGDLAAAIDDLWDSRDQLSPGDADVFDTVRQAIDLLDSGEARVAEIDAATDEVVVHEWLKRAILLLFKISAMETIELGPFEYADKVPLKKGYEAAGVRAVPGASARWGCHLEPGVILMPSYVNLGAYVGSGTMVDTWATVGSCAQIGKNVHLSGGVGIGGVLEPPQASPVIVEDDCMIGSRCMVTQGARVRKGVVLGEGAVLNPTIPVIDTLTGEIVGRGDIPAYSICVPGNRKREFPGGEFYLPCVLILRRYEPGERQHLNQMLRDEGVNVG